MSTATDEGEYKQFRELVEEMRLAQQYYFNHPQPETLGRAKNLERQVDRFLESKKHPALF